MFKPYFSRCLPWLLSVLVSTGVSFAVHAEEVRIAYNGLTLNAELSLADGANLGDGVVLVVHGTLAHNAMETISGLSAVMNERGLATLAINLSLGVDDRHGMYDCATPHRHAHMDALGEIDAWMTWLQDQGAGSVSLFGHSRGGNQAARYAAEKGHPLLRDVTLLAPATWDAERAAEAYEKSHGAPLSVMLKKAEDRIAAGKGSDFLDGAGLLYCPSGSDVTADSFAAYYRADPRFNTPDILTEISVPVLVIAGSEDTVVRNLANSVAPMADGVRLTFATVDGADHFFLDLYAEDVVDFMEELFNR